MIKISDKRGFILCGHATHPQGRLHIVLVKNVPVGAFFRFEKKWFRKMTPFTGSILLSPTELGYTINVPGQTLVGLNIVYFDKA